MDLGVGRTPSVYNLRTLYPSVLHPLYFLRLSSCFTSLVTSNWGEVRAIGTGDLRIASTCFQILRQSPADGSGLMYFWSSHWALALLPSRSNVFVPIVRLLA